MSTDMSFTITIDKKNLYSFMKDIDHWTPDEMVIDEIDINVEIQRLKNALEMCEHYLDDEPAYYHMEDRCLEYEKKFRKECEHCLRESEEE
jgi:hypothetical protein